MEAEFQYGGLLVFKPEVFICQPWMKVEKHTSAEEQ